MNLQYQYMKQALDHVSPLVDQDKALKTAYGALCHQIPILVLTNGLLPTAAFVDAKANGTSPRARAFQLIRTHLIATFGSTDMITSADDGSNPSGTTTPAATQTADELAVFLRGRDGAGMGMLDTMTVIDAWVYYKRFAVSILGVQAGDDDGESGTDQP